MKNVFMSHRFLSASLVLSALASVALPYAAHANGSEQDIVDRVTSATDVVKKLAGSDAADEVAIPKQLLEKAKCVVTIPNYKRAGFVFGGSYGAGVALCRGDDGSFSNPIFVNLVGGSWGFQAGFQITDMMLLMLNQDAPTQLLQNGGFKLGGEASVAVGPVGRDGYAGTNTNFQDETLEYASARGIFAGLSLNGSKMSPEKNDQQTATTSDAIKSALTDLETELKTVSN